MSPRPTPPRENPASSDEAGWHVLYDFGQDSHGEFLDYYAALRDGTDPTVTDDWHVRLYETGDRVQLPTVLEAYMYSRDPTPEELARAAASSPIRRHPQAAPPNTGESATGESRPQRSKGGGQAAALPTRAHDSTAGRCRSRRPHPSPRRRRAQPRAR